jgi:hypothetical protein
MTSANTKLNSRFLSRFMPAFPVQIYWSIRMHCWLWKEKHRLARLQKLGVMPGAGRLASGGAVYFSPAEEAALIADVAKELRLQPLLFGDGKSLIKALSGKECPGANVADRHDAHQTPAGREAQLIAQYDAHFLASVRIKAQ